MIGPHLELYRASVKSKASQDVWEMWQMLKQVAEIKPKVIVEIGVDGGGSLETWRDVFHPELLVGIDINKRPELREFQMIFADSQDPKTVAHLKRKLGDRKIDFLFIDGDHHYEAVKREYQIYLPLVREGGIIGFHDTNNRGIEGVEVDRFMRELDDMQAHKTADYYAGRGTPGTRLIWV